MTISILLADDHKMIRDGLKSLIKKEKDIEVAAVAKNGREAIILTEEINPDIVVMDINMPDLNGIEATRQIVKLKDPPGVIALSVYTSRRFVSDMLRAGASGYLVKECAFEELADAIRIVADNKCYLSPQIHGVVIKDLQNKSRIETPSVETILTRREREILQLIAEGVSSEKIASRLFISVKTVFSHRQQIMKKLNLHNIAQLTRYAIKMGIIFIDE